MEQKSSTAVSRCRCEVTIGKPVKLCLLSSAKWAHWCPGYTFTSQHTSSPPGLRSHRLSPSPKWSAWKPPQQSASQEQCQQQRVSQCPKHCAHCTNELLFRRYTAGKVKFECVNDLAWWVCIEVMAILIVYFLITAATVHSGVYKHVCNL